MKRTILGTFVGALLIFIWQSLSWTILNLHEPAGKYTPNESAILQSLAANLPEEGGYLLPNVPPGASREEAQVVMEAMNGKPWASVQYHKTHHSEGSAMIMNMIRLFLSNVIMLWLLMWIFNRIKMPTFGTIFAASIFVGLIAFINQPYTGHIWFEFFDIWAHLIDALVSWTLAGLWLGFLYNRRPTT